MLKFPLWNNFCCPVGRGKKKPPATGWKRRRQARSTLPEKEKLGMSLVGEAGAQTAKGYISQEVNQGKFHSHLSHQRKTRRRYWWKRRDQCPADTGEFKAHFNQRKY